MNIIEKVKEVFSKLPKGVNSFLGGANKVNIHETTIRRLSDYLNIRRQSYYKKIDKEMYNKIEEYKKKYMEKLRVSRMRFSWELGNDDINTKMQMAVDLIEKNFIDEMEFVTKEDDEVKKTVMLKKFELYLNDIDRIDRDLTARLVALTEIKEHNILSKKKENILNTEIENLEISLINLRNNTEAIMYVTKAYQDMIKCIRINRLKDKAESVSHAINNQQNKTGSADEERDMSFISTDIEELYKNLEEKVKTYINTQPIDDLDVSYYTKMAMLEKRLEEYFYTHPEHINSYINEFYEVVSDAAYYFEMPFRLNEYRSKKSDPQINLTKRIMSIQEQLKIYEKYGRALDTKFKEDYYRNKIKIIIYDNMVNVDTDIFNEYEEEARKTYIAEVEKRIDNIMRGKARFFLDKEKNKEAIKSIKNIFINSIGNLDAEAILTNNYLLSLLFALNERESGYYVEFLNEWFESNVFKEDFVGEKINDKYFDEAPGIIYNSGLPIRTICDVLSAQTDFRKDTSENARAISSLVDFYLLINSQLLHRKYNDSIYHVPEGIVQMGKHLGGLKNDYLDKLKEETEHEHVKMPSSLWSFYGNSAINDNVKCLEFSNGTKEINFDCYRIMIIIIPPSVKDLKIDFKDIEYGLSSPYCYHRTLIFSDYERSSFLNPKNDKDIAKANNYFNSLPNELCIELHSINGEKKAIYGRKIIEEWTKEGELKNRKEYAEEQDISITDKIVWRKKNDDTSSETKNTDGLISRAEI